MVNKTIKDLTAGTAGGICQVLVGQPFDIVKVRMQTAPAGTYSGMMHCAGGILKNEGPLAFYKGTLSPLLGIGVCVSIQFGALEYTKRYFSTQNQIKGRTELSKPQLFTAGVIAGLANGIVSCPVEHIRIRLQTQPSTSPLYSGPLDCILKISRAHGIPALFKGQSITFLREASGYGVYFLAYESLVQSYLRSHPTLTRNDVPAAYAVLYGAAAGYALWAVIYPVDVVKSRIQTDGFTRETGRRYEGSLDCVRKVWKGEGGARAFARGLGPTLIRSPFANGATFLGFELASRMMGSEPAS